MTNDTQPGVRWQIALGFQSDPGRAREKNEDAYALFVPYQGEERAAPVDGLFAVADGMGGHDAGDFASRYAADAVLRAVTAPNGEGPLEATFRRISRELREIAIERGASQGMGSTMTATVLRGDVLEVAHVGDTRLYRLRGDLLEQLTPDHSWVAEQHRAGLLTDEEAATHPRRNLLTQCLGIGGDLKVHRAEFGVQDGDRYLLCCDGLHGQLPDAVIARVLRDEQEPQVAVRRLVAMANETGGPDNITAVVFDLRRPRLAAATVPAMAATPTPATAVMSSPLATEIREAVAAEAAWVPRRRRGSYALLAAGAAMVLAAAGWSAYRSFGADDGRDAGVGADTTIVPASGPGSATSPVDADRDGAAAVEPQIDTAQVRSDSTGSAATGGARPQPNPDREESRS